MSTRVALAATFLVASATTQALTLTAGVADNFLVSDEVASPSGVLDASFETQGGEFSFGTQSFDLTGGINNGNPDRQVAHTFTGLPGGITAATLTARVRGGTDSFVSTDGIALSFVTSGTTGYLAQVVYARAFGGGSGGGSVLFSPSDPGLLQSAAWSTGSDVTFTLNLAALPLVGGGTLNLLADLNAKGFLDVNISDDTAVDFMTLEITAVPLPAAFFPLLSGLAVLGARRRRR